MADGDTIQQNPPASPIDNPPPPPIAPPSPKPMDEKAVLQMVGGITDKKQQIIQGVARGLKPMVSADNTDTQLVPPSRFAEAQQAGYQPATMMSDPDEQLYLVPHNQVQEAIKNHWTVGQPVGQPANKPISEVTDPSDPRYGSDAWYASKLPQPVLGGLQWIQRNINAPLDAAAQWGAQQVGRRAESAAAAFTTPSPAPVPNPQAPTGYLARMFSTQPKYLPITEQQQQQQLETARQQHPLILGAAKGAGETLGGMMADPRMWPLMFGGEALPVVQKLASAGFSAQMLYGAYQAYPEIKAAADRGDEEGVANLLTHFGLSAYMGTKGAMGAAGDLGLNPAVANTMADYLNGKAEEQFQRVLLRGGGTKKQKALAQKLAPEMADRGVAAWTSGQLERKSAAQMETAGKEIEQYYQGLPEGQTIPTKPLLNYFEQAKQEFMAPDSGAVLDQNAIDKVDALKQIVQQFGSDVSVDDIVKLRRLWDEQVASSAPGHLLPADESTAVGIKRDAADAIRGELAKQFPDLDKINKTYSFWKGINDVMSATNLRTAGHAKFSLTDLIAGGTPFGSLIHLGLGKATLGATTGLMLMRAVRSTAWETVSANIKSRIADYLADGNVAAASRVAAQATGQQPAATVPVGAQSSFTPKPRALPPSRELPPSTLPPQGALPPGPAGPPALAAQPGAPQISQGAIPLPESPLGANAGQQQYVATPTPQEAPFAPAEVVPPRMLGPARLPASISGPREAAEAAAARGTNLPRWAALGQPRPEPSPQATGTPAEPTPEINKAVGDLFTGNEAVKREHGEAVSSMLLGADEPPESIDWSVLRPGRGLPNAIELNPAARQMIGSAMGSLFHGVSMSPATLDNKVLPRLEMAAQAIDNTNAQRPNYFSPEASAKVRDLINTIQQNRTPEGVSFTRLEGTPEQQRYTTHEELFHTAVQRRPAGGGGGLVVPDLSDDPGMEKMRPRIINETGRLMSIVHHAEGMADIMQGRAPELTPEEAGSTAENYWTQLAKSGKTQALVDAFKLENFMDDHEKANGYTLDDATNAIRTAGRDALARVLSRQYGTDLRGLSRALQSEAGAGNVAGAARGAGEAGAVPTGSGEANLRSPAETAAGAGAGPEVAQLFSPDTEGNLRRKINREEDIGDPAQGKAVKLTREDGKPFYVGRMTPEQWIDKVQSYLKPDELTEWRNWYRDVRQHFVENSGGDEQLADRRMMGWLLTQQRASPAAGYQNLGRAEDIVSGLPEVKQPGLGAEKIYAALRGETPEAGLGAKLHDFVDSARGKDTRTWMGDDPRGGGPAVIDVHGGRDAGFVDEPMRNEIENQFGPKVANRFQVDMKGAPSETQYENGSQYYNDLVKQLNQRKFDGGNWRPEEVQAVGWAAQQRMTNRVPQLVKDIFEPSRRTISSELAFGKGSPYAKEFGKQWAGLSYEQQQAITEQVFKKIMEHASREAGGKVIQSISGPGRYQEYPVAPSMQHVIEGSPEAAERLANVIGHLAQQTEVMVSRPLQSGNKSAFQILEKYGEGLFRDPKQAESFSNDFRSALQQQAPKIAAKIEGFMPVEVNGQTGIRMVTGKGKFSNADLERLRSVAEEVGDRANIDVATKPFEGYVAEGAKNDWTKASTGRAYTSRLGQIGRPGIQGRLASASAEVRAEIRRAFQEHAPEAGVAPPAAPSSSPPVVPPQIRRVMRK